VEQEAEEVEKMQQYKFKAWELDPRILKGEPILLKKPPMKRPTQPVGFDLEIEKKANPIQKYWAVEVKLSVQPLTAPVSPEFSTGFHC
jgi:hypothetical protein